MAGSFTPRNPLQQKPPLGAQLRASHPLAQGLVAAWLMNEGGGTSIYDISGNNNTGTLTSGPTWVDSTYGPALSFNGSTNYVDCGSVLSGTITALSISFWVKFPTGQTVSVGWGSTSGGRAYVLFFSGTAYFVLENGGNNFASVTTPGANQWHHVVMTWDGGTTTRKGYFNGVSQTLSVTPPSAYTVTSAFQIAKDVSNGLYGTQVTQNVLVYNRALSADEVQQLYVDPYCFTRGKA